MSIKYNSLRTEYKNGVWSIPNENISQDEIDNFKKMIKDWAYPFVINEKCKYCEDSVTLQDKKIKTDVNNMGNKEIFALINSQQSEMIITIPDRFGVFRDNMYFLIKYCPMCGRKLR